MPRTSCPFPATGTAVPRLNVACRRQIAAFSWLCACILPAGSPKLSHAFSWLRRNFVILSMALAKVPVNGWKSCPITAWAHELDHISGGSIGHMAFSRPGHGLPVRPLYTRSGSPGKRPRSRTPRVELHAPDEARKGAIARDDPDQSAARSHRHAPLALNLRSYRNLPRVLVGEREFPFQRS